MRWVFQLLSMVLISCYVCDGPLGLLGIEQCRPAGSQQQSHTKSDSFSKISMSAVQLLGGGRPGRLFGQVLSTFVFVAYIAI